MYITRFITRIKIIITKNDDDDDDDDDDDNNNNNNNYNSNTGKIPGTVSIDELQPKAYGLNPVLQKLNKQNNTKKKSNNNNDKKRPRYSPVSGHVH